MPVKRLKWNFFDLQKDNPKSLLGKIGNYIICLNRGSMLPSMDIGFKAASFNDFEVIYTGVASKCLLTRDFKQHFVDGNAGKSTLRKSIGVLMGFTRIPRDRKSSNRKTKFSEVDELLLSRWMRDNLLLLYAENLNFNEDENKLIEILNPPLNINKNYNEVNSDYRKRLKYLRNA